jgi:hypothetical protein
VKNPIQLQLRSGDNFTRSLAWSTTDGEYPVNLTNCSVEFSFKSGSFERQFIDDEHASITDAVNGVIELSLSAIETREIRSSGYSSFKFEVTVTFPSGARKTILFGNLVFSGEAVK